MRPIIALIIAVLLSGCQKDQSGGNSTQSAEEQRIEKEVVRRVEIAGTVAKARQATLHTIRLVGFLLLAGGAVAALLWIRQPRSAMRDFGTPSPRPLPWADHDPPKTGRVIDFDPAARSASNHHRPRNHETPPRA